MYGLDLFSGIGGLTKALEGYVEPVAYCENDRYAQGVLLSRMSKGDIPVAPIWDDVSTLQDSELLIKPTIIYGGFPCQDISVAGRGEGLAGKRSGLFFEIVRLVGEIRPQFVFLENVPAITSRGLGTVLGEMASLGYDCRWGVLSASDVGAPHRRDRWWMLAHAKGFDERSRLCSSETRKERKSGNGSSESYVADADRPRRGKRWGGESIRKKLDSAECSRENVSISSGIGKTERRDARFPEAPEARSDNRTRTAINESGEWWKTEPAVGRLVDGIPYRVDQLRCLGNSVVPAQAREAFERLLGLK